MTPIGILLFLMDQCLFQSSSEKLLPAADKNKCRDLMPDTTWKESLSGMSLTNLSPQRRRGGRKNTRARGDGDKFPLVEQSLFN